MKEDYGDIWDIAEQFDAICITTNGYVKTNGEAVMGRGVALEAAQRYPIFPKALGYHIKKFGNEPFYFVLDSRFGIITYPVKPDYGQNGEMGWKAKAEPRLIINSAYLLMEMIEEFGLDSVALPRPGCGNGGLTWEEVKPLIENILDDRVTVITWSP